MNKKLLFVALLLCVTLPAILTAWSFDYTSTGTTSTVTGVRNDGLKFETGGTNNYITFADSGDYVTTGLTLSFWYNSSTQQGNNGIFQKGDMNTHYDLALIKVTGSWIFRCFSACPGASGGYTDYVISSQDDGNWHHIVVSISSSLIEMYVDGAYVAPNTPGSDNTGTGGFSTTAAYDLTFGAYYSGSYTSTYTLDELAIFSDAISSGDVSTYYNSGDGYAFTNETNLIYYNDFSGGAPATIPTVSTDESTNVAKTLMTLNGSVSSDGGEAILERGFAYGTVSDLSSTIATSTIGTSGSFVENISSLSCNTTYYFRAYAENTVGIGYGTIGESTTLACTPDVTTNDASSVVQLSAVMEGEITATYGSDATQRTIVYDNDSDLSSPIDTVNFGGWSGTGVFSTEPSLSCGTTYYFQASATNGNGASYGAIKSFTTIACGPDIITVDDTTVTDTTATLYASITNTYGNDATERGFLYGTVSDLSTVIATTTLGPQVGPDAYNQEITGLTCETTYYARAYAVNITGIRYANIVSFQTADCPQPPPVVVIDNVTPIASTSATLRADVTSVGGSQISQHGFAYGTVSDLSTTIATTSLGIKASVGQMQSSISGLSNNTTYYYRGYATNVQGTSYTTIGSFTTGTYLIIGAYGDDNEEINIGYGVGVDTAGNIYASDNTVHAIKKFSPTGAYITRWGSVGSADGQFNNPRGIAVDASDNVYVADFSNNRIQKFDSSGNHLATWGSTGNGNGQFSGPLGIDIDSSGNIYVAELYNHRIQKFDSSGTYVTKWGSNGSGNGQFTNPSDVAVDSEGNVYVADYSNSRVQKFTSSGTYITKWGTAGTGNGQFSNPAGIAVGADDMVYVVDVNQNRVQKFTKDGVYLAKIGSSGSGNGQFSNPFMVKTSPSGDLAYVAEYSNNRVQAIFFTHAPVATTTTATSVTKTTATLNANILSLGGSNISAKGFAYGTDSALTTVIATTSLGTQTATGTFSGGITGLTCNTAYYFRAYATNDTGTSYGSITSFNTSALCPPSVTTSAPTSVATSTLTLNGTITATGGENASQSGFAYSTDSGLTTGVSTSTLGAQTGTASFSLDLTGLTPDTVYYFRAYATSSAGIGYGSIVSTTTHAIGVPTVTTSAASSITDTGATGNGNITYLGGFGVSTRGFVYGTTASYGATTTSSGSFSTGVFTDTLTGLTCNTTYHIAAYAENSQGFGYGSDDTFTTSACASSPGSGSGGSSGTRHRGGAGFIETVILDVIDTVWGTSTTTSNTTKTKPGPSEIGSPSDEVKEVVPKIYTEAWSLIDSKGAKAFVLQPLPDELIALSVKFPELKKILVDTGVTKAADIGKLRYSTLSLPTVNSFKELPSEVIFARTGLGNIDIPTVVQVTEGGAVQQKVQATAGSSISLALKVDGAASSVKGYIVFKQTRDPVVFEESSTMNIAAILLAHKAHAQSVSENVLEGAEFVVGSFDYNDLDGDGVYTADVRVPQVEGEYEIITLITYKDPKRGTRELRLVTLVDPEGYVYEMNGGNETRIPQVTVTLWKGKPGSGVAWDASKYKQRNPQITDKTGRYSFLVPEGTYYVTADSKGYVPYTSDVFEVVRGEGVHFNIEMRKTASTLRYLLDWRSLALGVIIVALIINYVGDRRSRRRKSSVINQ